SVSDLEAGARQQSAVKQGAPRATVCSLKGQDHAWPLKSLLKFNGGIIISCAIGFGVKYCHCDAVLTCLYDGFNSADQ
ncbi:hypothetical protein, partial [Pseudomonas savastanoi]|uniref:hypothetical protein n=1 Tax=Pseudomonas savastanoi TaxID=29438 RepID=UPI001CC1CE0E